MKYIKSINENEEITQHVVYYVNDELIVDILGIFDSMEDADIYILNYINADILELYVELQDMHQDKDKNKIESYMFSINQYTTDRDADGNLIFLDADQALEWNYNRSQSTKWRIDYQMRKIFKPKLVSRIKDAMEIKKYNI